MKSLESDIKNGNIKNIYLLMGVEGYLINQYRDKLINALIGSDDKMNLKRFIGESPDVNEIISTADTMPFFAERRVITIEDSHMFKLADDKLASYLKELPDTTYIIFTECYTGDRSEEKKYEKYLVDKRYKLYKAVHEHGRVIAFPRLSEDMLNRWIVKKLSDEGLKITMGALDCLYEYVGNDMNSLANEVEKLISYKYGAESVQIEDVKAICSRNLSNDIFEMVSSIATKNHKKALQLYYNLLSLKESPMKILRLVTREFNILMQVKAIKGSGGGNNDIAAAIGVDPRFVGKYVSVSSRFTYEYLKKAVEECIETETLFKQGRINDVIGVEMLIVKYSAPN